MIEGNGTMLNIDSDFSLRCMLVLRLSDLTLSTLLERKHGRLGIYAVSLIHYDEHKLSHKMQKKNDRLILPMRRSNAGR